MICQIMFYVKLRKNISKCRLLKILRSAAKQNLKQRAFRLFFFYFSEKKGLDISCELFA